MNEVFKKHFENNVYEIEALQTVGDRESQQDCYGCRIRGSEAILVVCDGVGGLDDGDRASNFVVSNTLELFDETEDFCPDTLKNKVHEFNETVKNFTNNQGKSISCGTTLVAVMLNENKLRWVNIGDSRLYLFRNEILSQITIDHTYGFILNSRYNEGLIDEELYLEEMKKGDLLASYFGDSRVRFIEMGNDPITIDPEDRVILMTDGMYKLLDEETMAHIIADYRNMNAAVEKLNEAAFEASRKKGIRRDNTTVVMARLRQSDEETGLSEDDEHEFDTIRLR